MTYSPPSRLEELLENYGSPQYARASLVVEYLPSIKEAEKCGDGNHETVQMLRDIVQEINEYLALAESDETS
jgi:hypothetical protein